MTSVQLKKRHQVVLCWMSQKRGFIYFENTLGRNRHCCRRRCVRLPFLLWRRLRLRVERSLRPPPFVFLYSSKTSVTRFLGVHREKSLPIMSHIFPATSCLISLVCINSANLRSASVAATAAASDIDWQVRSFSQSFTSLSALYLSICNLINSFMRGSSSILCLYICVI